MCSIDFETRVRATSSVNVENATVCRESWQDGRRTAKGINEPLCVGVAFMSKQDLLHQTAGKRAVRKTAFSAAALMLSPLMLSALPGCTHTLVFSDTAPIVVTGTPPVPPPPPPKPPELPAKPAAPKLVEVQKDQIVIREKIQFETDKAAIKPESSALLEEITRVVQENAQLKKISIEGHTDSDGKDAYNMKLSDGRAKAVMEYLVEHGVDAGRLAAKGFGETKPMVPNDSAENKEKNRRVEFMIVEQDVVKKTYEEDPKTGARKEVGSTEEKAP
jgi:OOP family OmpA-OmpF porin